MERDGANGTTPRRSIRRFLRRAWQGRVRLVVAYWILGVGGNMGFVLILALIYFVGPGPVGLLWFVYLASLAWFVLVFRSVHRAADAYPGRRLWASLAKLGVTVGIVRMAGEAVFFAAPALFSAGAALYGN